MKIIEYFKKRKQRKEEKRQRQSKTVRILKTVGGTILYVSVLVLLVWGTPKALSSYLKTSYPMAAITSSSMWPELKKHDLVFIEGVAPQEIKVGDIIVYKAGLVLEGGAEGFVIHRVIEIKGDSFVTKGDANTTTDSPTRFTKLVGRTVEMGDKPLRIPKLGFISTAISNFRK